MNKHVVIGYVLLNLISYLACKMCGDRTAATHLVSDLFTGNKLIIIKYCQNLSPFDEIIMLV